MDFIFYSALEFYGGVGEIKKNSSIWEPGGGYDNGLEGNEPDIFDLIGSTMEDQLLDLNNYQGATPTMISRSAISISFGTSTLTEGWHLY